MGSSLKGALNAYSLIIASPEKVSDLFGYLGLESRVYFRDAIVSGEYSILKLGRQWRPRKSCGGIKVYTSNNPQYTSEEIYFEAIPKGKTFTPEIVLNGDENDLQLLIAAMGAKKYGIKIGRGKDRGYGIVKLVNLDVSPFVGSKIEISNIITEAQQLIERRWNDVRPAFFS